MSVVVSDVAEVKEALASYDEILATSARSWQLILVLDAARRWVRVAEGLDYEAAMEVADKWRGGLNDYALKNMVSEIVVAAVGVEKED